jgi:magnesium transporter
MIEILKVEKHSIRHIPQVQHNCWINVIEPTAKDIYELRKHLVIPETIINALRDKDEVPSVQEHKDYTFIIIRTPYNDPKVELRWTTQPLGIFLHNDFVITVCYEKNDVMEKLKELPFEFKKSQFVLRALLHASNLYLSYLKIIHKQMIRCEEELEVSQKNKVIMNFLELEKSLVYFTTSLKSNAILLEKLEKNRRLMKHRENAMLLDHIDEETKQGIQMAEVYSNILSNTLDAFASIISNNLNISMKTLTSLTLIFNVPILIASIYGMNVALPLGHHQYAFLILMSTALIFSGIAIFIFIRKKYF